jgi:hypothetical protein
MDNFFGSKLNTFLLLILIILMAAAIRIMLQTKELYLQPFTQNQTQKGDDPKSQISGHTEDFVFFSILPGSKLHGVVSYRGAVRGGYFFEGNILINVLDINKKNILKSNATAKTEWMIRGPVDFEGNLDFSKLPKGPAYIEIHNDNPSGIAINDKSILIPIVIE